MRGVVWVRTTCNGWIHRYGIAHGSFTAPNIRVRTSPRGRARLVAVAWDGGLLSCPGGAEMKGQVLKMGCGALCLRVMLTWPVPPVPAANICCSIHAWLVAGGGLCLGWNSWRMRPLPSTPQPSETPPASGEETQRRGCAAGSRGPQAEAGGTSLGWARCTGSSLPVSPP